MILLVDLGYSTHFYDGMAIGTSYVYYLVFRILLQSGAIASATPTLNLSLAWDLNV